MSEGYFIVPDHVAADLARIGALNPPSSIRIRFIDLTDEQLAALSDMCRQLLREIGEQR